MSDLFGKTVPNTENPITADACAVIWDGKTVSTAINFSLEYSQPVTRRRSIGSQAAIIYGGQPMGRASIGRLLTEKDVPWDTDSWKNCKSGKIEFQLGGNCAGKNIRKFIATGCIVSAFTVQANADDLTVADNVAIEFLELTRE